jgi:ABC-2 type transport system ATP-binding protein
LFVYLFENIITEKSTARILGLLGSNGAGKTTTLNMLTGDVQSTGGKAYVAGHDITGIEKDGVADARKNIGFCPQIDP